ncbi:potassium transporter TrkG [Thermosediminibacter oceani]|uniref:Cation transporter n=1 Tax=Thermosediminibacter oceani (strain ATCC BAA-1034 / DSM 16646 / JW/IW-1228P) TaxID=555079 RepID=D9RZR0_THEOJ|nr:potassium transporter TrkG [Thermosediminibacter oceani]ADL08687.1 cation transporter [Thermosediminibacter oceani DSM 16646]
MYNGSVWGSTAGGIKNIRILLIFKIIRNAVLNIVHPRAVYSVRDGGMGVKKETKMEVLIYFVMYMIIFFSAVVIVALDGKDIVTTFTSVVANLCNVGPGLERVGPAGIFRIFLFE